MTFPSRYIRSLIASGFGAAFLFAAPRFAAVATAAPTKSGVQACTMIEFVNGVPAAGFSIAGTGLLIWAAVYAIARTRTSF